MATCPYCNAELEGDALREGHCRSCGRTIEWGETVDLSASNFGDSQAEPSPPAADQAGQPAGTSSEQPIGVGAAGHDLGGSGHGETTFFDSQELVDGGSADKAATKELDAPRVPVPTVVEPPLDQTIALPDTAEVPANTDLTMAIEAVPKPGPFTMPAVGDMTDSGSLHPRQSPGSPEDDVGLDEGLNAASVASDDPRQTLKGSSTAGRDTQLVIKQRVVQSQTVQASHTGEMPANIVLPTSNSPDYELLGVLGKGGMGVVYSARQTSVNRTVAVKMLKQDIAADAGHRQKFLSEAVVTGELDHPNIVAIYELGSNNEGALFYSMKRVEGTPWSKVIGDKSQAENLEILMKVSDAVGFAHSRGVVHRDLKPENVMLGEFGEVLLMDWGMALPTAQFRKSGSVSPSHTMGGTPAYMAPEMATGPIDRIGPASDIYLLGAILFEVITGDPPHSGKTVMDCLRAAMKNVIRPVTQNGEWMTIARHAMATNPAERYATVRELQDAMRKAQSHAESIALAALADQALAEARNSGDYQTYSRALFGYQEALSLWDGNDAARGSLTLAKLAYAQHALRQGDLDLAESLLDRDLTEHRETVERVAEAQAERAARQRRLTKVKRLVVGMAVTMLVMGIGAYLRIRSERDKAVIAEGKATESAQKEKVAAERARVAKVAAEDSAAKEKIAAEQARLAKDAAVESAVKEKAAAEQARKAKEAEEYEAYVARIGLAAAKIDENAYDQAAQLLADCDVRMRHWEWGRLAHLCSQSVYSFPFDAPVNAISVSADGSLLATASWDGSARLWDLARRELRRTIPYGATYVNAVAISPDRKLLAVGGSDKQGYVKLFDADQGTLLKTFKGHTDGVLSVAFSGDGRQLLTSSYDNSARLWDVATGEARQAFQGHTWWVWAAAFSPDQKRIVTASQDRTVRVWSIATGESGAPFTASTGPVYCAVFSPDGRQVATGGYDQQIRIFEPEDLKPFDYASLVADREAAPQKFRSLKGHTAPVRTLRYSADGSRLLTGGDDNTLRIWDAPGGDLLKTLRGHAGWVRSCEFSPNGQWVLSGSHDHTVKLWSIAGYEEVRIAQARVFQGHTDAILSASFSPDGQQIVTASRDRTARLWDLSLARELRKFEEGHQYLATRAVFFPDGKTMLTAAGDNTACIWDATTGTQRLRLEPTGRSAAVALMADGRQILTGSDDRTIKLWDAESGKLVQSFAGLGEEITAVASSPSSPVVAAGDAAGTCLLWNATTGQPLAKLRGHTGRITDMVFLPGGDRLLTASEDKTVGQWDVSTGRELESLVLRHPDAVTSLALGPHGELALTSCEDGQVRLWNLAKAELKGTVGSPGDAASYVAIAPSGEQVLAVSRRDRTVRLWKFPSLEEITGPDRGPYLSGQAGNVWSAAFSADGSRLLTVAGSGARLWDIGKRDEIMTFSPNGAVASVQFSPDGARLVTGSWDGSARLWDVATGQSQLKLQSDRYVNSAAFSPDGKLLMLGTDDPRVRLCSAQTGALIKQFTGHTGRVVALAFSPDGSRAVTGSDDKTARIWDVATGRQLMELRGHERAVVCLAFSGDGERILTGSDDKTALIWDAVTGDKLMSLEGHTAGVTSVAFAPDGRRALTASHDTTAKLWDIDRAMASTAKELLSLKAHSQPLTSVCFSPDGSLVLTASRDGTAILWLATDWHRPRP